MREEIYSKLEDLKRYVGFLKGYQNYGPDALKNDHTLRGAVERYFQLALECTLNIGERIISHQGFQKPDSYREVIQTLGEEGILPSKFASRFAPCMDFINTLVHQYAEVDMNQLYLYLQHRPEDFNIFARHVARYLEDQPS